MDLTGNILIIHPEDKSTSFLKNIYKTLGGNIKLITNPGVPNREIKSSIKEADIVILLGHGTEYGLLSDSQGKRFSRLIVGSERVEELRKKKLVFGIWCNANIFFEKYGIKGFSTGMFISELSEAIDYSIKTTQEEIDRSNEKFALGVSELIPKLINLEISPEEFSEEIKRSYNSGNSLEEFNTSGFFAG